MNEVANRVLGAVSLSQMIEDEAEEEGTHARENSAHMLHGLPSMCHVPLVFGVSTICLSVCQLRIYFPLS